MTESASAITLYVSASRSDKSPDWNCFMLKARYALNVKRLHYEIVTLEYPEIEPAMRSISAPPTGKKSDGTLSYTLPVVVDPIHRASGGGPIVVSDTWAIAEYLDAAYPDQPKLFPYRTKALQRLFHDHFWTTVFQPVGPIVVLAEYNVLNEASRPYWRRTREMVLGERLEEACPNGTPKSEAKWSGLEKGFTSIAGLLAENESGAGEFVMGNKVSYADLTILSILESVFVLLPEDWERRVKHWDGGRWEKLRNTSAAFMH